MSLKTELVLEAASEVSEAALAVVASVGHLADVVEHVSAGEEQDENQADGSPQVAVLNDGKNVWRSDSEEGEDTDDSGCDGDDLEIVDRTLDRWVRGVGKVTAQPSVNRLGLVGTDAREMLVFRARMDMGTEYLPREEVEACGRGVSLRVGSSGGMEEEQNRRGLQLQLIYVSHCNDVLYISRRLTDWKTDLPSKKSNVPNNSLPSPALSPLLQLRASKSHSGWKSLQRPQPNLASRAVSRTATE